MLQTISLLRWCRGVEDHPTVPQYLRLGHYPTPSYLNSLLILLRTTECTVSPRIICYVLSMLSSCPFSFQFRNHPAIHDFLHHRKEVFIQTLTPALHPEVRSLVGIPALTLASCMSSGSYNKTPQGGWLINGRNQCLPVLKPGNPRSGGQKATLSCLIAGPFTLCPDMAEGAGSSPDSHL